jgi:hypothetical protein
MRLRGAKLIVLGMLGFCASIGAAAVAQQAEKSSTADFPKAPYAVEGSALGARVERDSQTYRAYQCSPSEQFSGFTWCNRTSARKTSRGRAYSSYSILHSGDGTIVYANKTLVPAFSSSTDANDEIQQIAQKYGAQPRIIEMPRRPGLPDGLIAVWGDVVLEPVDANNLIQLAAGKTPQLGFIVDFIADFQRSAKNGLPIYRISGGAGSVWAASYGQPDRGTLRFIAVDASKLSPAPNQAPIVGQPSPASDQAALVAPPSPIPNQSPIEPSEPTAKTKESDANIAELKQTIASLKADLASSAAKIARLESQNSETERVLRQQAQARIDAEKARQQIEQASIAEKNAAYGAARFRLLQVVGYIVIGGLITLLLIAALVFWKGWKGLIFAFRQGMKSDSDAKAEENNMEWSAVSFGRDLEKHVAKINATPSNRPV